MCGYAAVKGFGVCLLRDRYSVDKFLFGGEGWHWLLLGMGWDGMRCDKGFLIRVK